MRKTILDYFIKPNGRGQLLDKTTPKMDTSNDVLKEAMLEHLLYVTERNSEVYGITLTLNEKRRELMKRSEDPLLQHRYIIDKIRRSRIWNKQKKYILFPEFTKAGKLHYHGIIYDTFQLEVARIDRWWRREIGYTKLEMKLSSKNSWIKYITKDYGKTGLWTIHNVTKMEKLK